MTCPSVSIVLPTLNGAKFIEQSIKSCLTQSHKNLELIIVDGGSVDGTLEIVNEFEDPRIKVIDQPPNFGRLPGALNLGFKQATGDYLTWTSDDNYYSPTSIERMLRFLELNPDVSFVYTDYERIDANNQFIARFHSKSKDNLKDGNCIGHCFLYHRTVSEKIGEYDLNFFMAEDYEYWLRIARFFKMANIPEVMYYYRVHEKSLTDSPGGIEAIHRVVEAAKRKWIGPDPFIYPSRFARSVATTYIDRAFEEYHVGNWSALRYFLRRGIFYDYRWLQNLGVVSLSLQALFPPLRKKK